MKYHGSQYLNAPKILKLFPPPGSYDHFATLFSGGLSVLLRAPKVKVETAVDLNDRVMNFFRQVRDNEHRLVRLINLTPWHQSEYELSQVVSDDKLEDARRFFFNCWMSINGGSANPGFRWTKKPSGRGSKCADDGWAFRLHEVATRIKEIQFMTGNGVSIAKKLNNSETLLYADPPFQASVRSSGGNRYKYETSDTLHRDLASVLNKHKGFAIISGKPCLKNGSPNLLYRELYEDNGWVRHDFNSRENSGSNAKHCVWNSERTEEARKKCNRSMRLL